MTETQTALAEAAYIGRVSHGGFARKQQMAWGNVLSVLMLPILLITLAEAAWMDENLRMALMLLLVLLEAFSAILLWFSVRVLSKTARLQKCILSLSDAQAALDELEACNSADLTADRFLLGNRFAFFFDTGVVIEYRNVQRLSVERREAINGVSKFSMHRIYTLSVEQMGCTRLVLMQVHAKYCGRNLPPELRDVLETLRVHMPDAVLDGYCF